jgi:predicted TPR repeat methyltransferase
VAQRPTCASQVERQIVMNLCAQGQHEQVLQFTQSLSQQYTNDAFARKMMGASLRVLKRIDDSMAPLQNVAKLGPMNHEALHNLQEVQQYNAPEQLAALVRHHKPPAANSLDVLDLGCGTGMLEKPEAAASYGLIVAADVFIHLGKIDKVVAEAHRLLRPGGMRAVSLDSLTPAPEARTGGIPARRRTVALKRPAATCSPLPTFSAWRPSTGSTASTWWPRPFAQKAPRRSTGSW